MKTAYLFALMAALSSPAFAQRDNVYEIYAIEYARPQAVRGAAKDIAVGINTADSISWSYYIWYLKGNNGRRVLVDAGYIDDSPAHSRLRMGFYQRPDLALRQMNVNPEEITDLVITHPHLDHIDGVDLFPRAAVWMQKNDFAYFVGDAWQEGANHRGLDKADVRKIIEVNLEGRLRLVDGDSLEILPGIRVFIGSKHTYECQFLLVNSATEKVVVASDASWFYYNLDHLASVPLTFDTNAYVAQLRRMKSLASDPRLVVPGHDGLVLSRFPRVSEHVVRVR
jgi:glyoxylase-like metal-dependent hydrolase (beta-lactamase superfamily II)